MNKDYCYCCSQVFAGDVILEVNGKPITQFTTNQGEDQIIKNWEPQDYKGKSLPKPNGFN